MVTGADESRAASDGADESRAIGDGAGRTPAGPDAVSDGADTVAGPGGAHDDADAVADGVPAAATVADEVPDGGDTVVSGAGRELRRRLLALSVVPGWVGLAVVLAAVVLVGAPSPAVQLAVIGAGTALIGLPHGAVDHLTPSRAAGEAPDRRALAGVGLLYLVLGGAYAVGWFLAPAAAAVGFVALTWVHWGQGDVWPLVALAPGDHPDDRVGRVLTAAVRGALPMVVPLVAFPEWYRRVMGWFAAPFGGSAAAFDPLLAPATRIGLGAAAAVLSGVALARGYRRAGGSLAWRTDAAETLLLWAFFLLVPPVLAVGAYFALWHSLRHVGRLVAIDGGGRTALLEGGPAAALARFGREAAPLTAVSLLGLAGLWALVPAAPAGPGEVLGLVLAFVAVLTLPHVVVVGVLDRAQGVWTP